MDPCRYCTLSLKKYGISGRVTLDPAHYASYVNQNFRNRDMIEVKRFIGGLLGLQPRRHSFKEHLACVPPDDKMEEANKGKDCKATVSYINYLSRIIIGVGMK